MSRREQSIAWSRAGCWNNFWHSLAHCRRQSRSYLQRIAPMMNAEDIDAAPALASGGLMATPEYVVEVTAPAIGPAAEDTPQAGGALGGTPAD